MASLNGLGIQHCHDLWCRLQTWLGSLVACLWCRPAAVAPIRPLAWEFLYATGMALKSEKKKKMVALNIGKQTTTPHSEPPQREGK